MEEKLQIVLKDYVKGVENVCNILIKSINCSENLNLKGKYDFMAYRSKLKKMEFEAGGISYRLHGKGCEAFNEKKYFDWEFGFRSRWCGIEPWKVSMTLKENKSSYIEYYDGDIVKSSCDLLVEEGIMFKKNDLYYFEIPKSATFKPEFPIEYDTLIVEHSDSKWLIPRNKVIDRFIRKSSWVYNQINRNEDNYILRFLFQGREIYTIPYNDIGYPENAVKIMSDNIINNLLKTK